MGQKVNPNGLRFGVNKQWNSRWYAQDKYQMAQWLVEDDKIRKYLVSKYKSAGIDHVEIERGQKNINVFVYATQPGLLIGNEASEKQAIELAINKIVGRKIIVSLKVLEVQIPELQASLMAREIADQIENRVSFRNAQKSVIRKVLKAGAKGIKTRVSGRLGGVEMAREEGYSQGIITLQTLRTDIDYSVQEAHTTYGIIGVKVWINRGQIFGNKLVNNVAHAAQKEKNNQKNNRKNFNRSSKPRTKNVAKEAVSE